MYFYLSDTKHASYKNWKNTGSVFSHFLSLYFPSPLQSPCKQYHSVSLPVSLHLSVRGHTFPWPTTHIQSGVFTGGFLPGGILVDQKILSLGYIKTSASVVTQEKYNVYGPFSVCPCQILVSRLNSLQTLVGHFPCFWAPGQIETPVSSVCVISPNTCGEQSTVRWPLWFPHSFRTIRFLHLFSVTLYELTKVND